MRWGAMMRAGWVRWCERGVVYPPTSMFSEHTTASCFNLKFLEHTYPSILQLNLTTESLSL